MIAFISNMKNLVILLGCCALLGGCLQDNKAPVSFKEGVFYGRDGYYDRGGNELPRYNNANRAELPPEQEAKYINDNQHSYGVSAEVDPIATTELPPPEQTTPPIETPPPASSAPASTMQDSPLVPSFEEKKNEVGQTRLEWQRKADNAPSEYEKKASQAQAEADHAQRAAEKELQAMPVEESYVPADIIAPTPPPAPEQEIAQAEKEAAAALTAEQAVTPTPAAPAAPAKEEPFVWPLKGKILKDFVSDPSKGIVIAGRTGEPVRASASGVVVHVGDKIPSLGNMIIIQHVGGYVTTYAHLSETVVSVDDNVVGGQLIGFVGKTGNAAQPQLHFAIRHNTEPLDPMKKLK